MSGERERRASCDGLRVLSGFSLGFSFACRVLSFLSCNRFSAACGVCLARVHACARVCALSMCVLLCACAMFLDLGRFKLRCCGSIYGLCTCVCLYRLRAGVY